MSFPYRNLFVLTAVMFVGLSPSAVLGQEDIRDDAVKAAASTAAANTAFTPLVPPKLPESLYSADWRFGLAQADQQSQAPPERGLVGPSKLVPSTWSDLAAFRRRRSSWGILGSSDRQTVGTTPFDLQLPSLRSALQPALQGAQAQTPPEPAHTGFKALIFETASDFNAYPRRQSAWVILGIGGAAAALGHPVDDEVNTKLAGSDAAGQFFAPGKYIGSFYAQAGVATGLYVVGRYMLPHAEGAPKTNKVSHIGFDMLRALVVSQTLTQGIKIAVRRDRPTGECCAFPSGHASATFATAAVIERHFGYRGSWPMFVIASYVATSRLHDNRHFLSDVMFGAAVGVSSGWTVVGRHRQSQFALTPVPVRGGMMVALTRQVATPDTR